MLHKTHFSLEQANKLLKEMKPMIIEMSVLKYKLDSTGYDIYRHEYFGGIGPNGTGAFPDEMEQLIVTIKKITSRGILIKNFNNGLVDFPHVRSNGDEVYLCWMLGEESIKFWHNIPDGFPGRRKIEEL
jgi:hypothetical protein